MDEQIDVLDAFAHPTGQVLPKREVHERELWHAGAHVWIYNPKGQLLLQHRHPGKTIYPDTWDISAAGHLSAGDTPEQAAVRETKEELGLDIKPGELEFIGVSRTICPIAGQNWSHHVFDWNYIVRRDLDPSELTLRPGETIDAQWRDLDVVEADQRDPVRSKQYSPRQLYLYGMALTEIRAALQRPVS
jgi:isopentenyldiphosphate isomerase